MNEILLLGGRVKNEVQTSVAENEFTKSRNPQCIVTLLSQPTRNLRVHITPPWQQFRQPILGLFGLITYFPFLAEVAPYSSLIDSAHSRSRLGGDGLATCTPGLFFVHTKR